MGGSEASHTTRLVDPDYLAGRQYAGFWHRAAALLIDGVIILIVELLLSMLVGIGEGSVTVFVLVFAYYVLGTAWGATIGRYVLRLRVVNSEGNAPGLASALVRSFVEIISSVALFLGYLWMLWDKDKQTWHDKAARTYVVRL